MITYLRRIPGRLGLALLKFALRTDPALARTWHSNMEQLVKGCFNTRTNASEVAHRLMKRLFDVERPKPPL